jgi:hypothetical protein
MDNTKLFVKCFAFGAVSAAASLLTTYAISYAVEKYIKYKTEEPIKDLAEMAGLNWEDDKS